MLPRWNTSLNNINLFINALDEVLSGIEIESNKRGRPPKHDRKDYLKLIIIKEWKKRSLRAAETDYSELVCGKRVDHSVIHYEEKVLGKELIERVIMLIGQRLDVKIGYEFSVIDATKFTTWKNKTVEYHLLTRIAKETVYPASVFFGSVNPSRATGETLIEGNDDLLGDAWYDDNLAIKTMFQHGYNPIIKPNQNRSGGYWRRKARKLYSHPTGKQKYRQRGRGESTFGSLTVEFGDRLKTIRNDTTMVRIGCRIIAYQLKIYVRNNIFYIVIMLFGVNY